MTYTKIFRLGDVLSVTTGVLLPENEDDIMAGLYEIYDFVLGRDCTTIDLLTQKDIVRDIVLRQCPNLADVRVSDVSGDNYKDVLADLREKYGNKFEITVDRHEG